MELQLGLGLCSTKSLDLNRCSFECNDREWELSRGAKRRCFAFEDENEPQTLPLLQWNHQPPSDEEDNGDDDRNCSLGFIKADEEEEEEDGVVGWPPLKMKRKKHCYRDRNNRRVENGCADCKGRTSNSTYIKVKVDGVGIARKIDLTRFNSFEMLKSTLLDMFELYEDNSRSYRLSYQDPEGDWFVAEDICWRSFIMSVQRLRLIRRRGG